MSGDMQAEFGMNEEILVSIITVCYNSEKTIAQTMESVLNQSYSNVEYLIIDGQSTDRTIEIIGEYQKKFGEKMKVISEPDEGIYDAMNKGIRMASGEVIGILNSDDFYEPDAILNMVEVYRQSEKRNPMVLYGEMRTWRYDKEDSIVMLSPEFLEERMIAHPSCFINKIAYEQFGTYDTSYCSVADYDLMLRYKESKAVEFIPVYHLITNFRIGGMSSTPEAYLDLLYLQKNHGLISKRQYRRAKWKAVLAGKLHKNRE